MFCRPSDVGYVNLTWTSGQKKYRYHFDQLSSLNEEVLLPPVISIKQKGKIPQEPTRALSLRKFKKFFYTNNEFCFLFIEFSVMLPCSNSSSGVAKFSLGLIIMKGRGKVLPGTPIRLILRKECSPFRGMNSSTLDFSPQKQGRVFCFLKKHRQILLKYYFAFEPIAWTFSINFPYAFN